MFALVAMMFIGCSTTVYKGHGIEASAYGAPASEWTVKVTKGPNNNTNISVSVKHLALPSKVSLNATAYVVWIEPLNGGIQNIGALVVNNNFEGTLNSTTLHRQFKVIVTAEPSARVYKPTKDPVFTTNVDRDK
jgi:hypothetical protein